MLGKVFKRGQQKVTGSDAEAAPMQSHPAVAPPRDPYSAAKAEFNETYGSFITQARNWRLMALLASMVAVTSVVALAIRANQSKFVPFVVKVDKFGVAQTVGLATRVNSATDDQLVRPYLARFLTNCRGVSVDPVIAKQMVSECFGMIGGSSAANQKMTEYFTANNPLLRGRTETVEVVPAIPLRITNESWQLAWQEVTRDLAGKVLSRRDWKATVTVAFNPPQDESQVLLNPLGLYVVDLDWRAELAQ